MRATLPPSRLAPTVLSLFALLLLAVARASAQAPVATIPAGHLQLEGDSSHHAGWRFRPGRAQFLYGPAVLGGGFVLQHLWVRGDGPTSYAAPQTLDVELRISSLGVNAWGSPSLVSFAANHGIDARVFFPRGQLNMPGWTSASAGPRPFATEFKGSAPFVVPPGAGLCVDLLFFAPAAQSVVSFADAALASRYGSASESGSAAAPADFHQYASGTFVGAPDLQIYGYSRGGGEVAVQWLGTAPAQLPLPGLGATLHTLPVFWHPVPVLTSAGLGQASFSYGSPPPWSAGLRVWSQIATIDAGFGLKLSRGLEITIGVGASGRPDFGCVYGYASGTRGFDPLVDAPQYAAPVGLVLGR